MYGGAGFKKAERVFTESSRGNISYLRMDIINGDTIKQYFD